MFNIIKVAYMNTRNGFIPVKGMFLKMDTENLTEIDIRDENKCDFCYNNLAKRTLIKEGLLELTGSGKNEEVKWIGAKPTIEMVAGVNENLTNARKDKKKKYAVIPETAKETLINAIEEKNEPLADENPGEIHPIFHKLIESNKTVVESNNELKELILRLTGWLE
jgi:hypothetical protein